MSQNRIRIALIITELEVGGAERCLVHIARGLAATEFTPVVYSLAPAPAPPKDHLIPLLQQANVPVHFLGFKHRRTLPYAVRSLRRNLANQSAQVALSFLFHSDIVTTLATWGRNQPPVCLGIRVAEPSHFRQRAERWAVRRAARVISVSQSVAAYAESQLGVDASKHAVIPNGVDVQWMMQAKPIDLTRLGMAPGRRVIACVARLDRQKGLDLLLEHAPSLLASLPEHDLLLVGDGPEAELLREIATRRGIAHRVHFAGWRPDVGSILAASELLILPSRWEGMPNVLLEAMAIGLPVASSQADGVDEVLGPLAKQQTAPVGDTESLIRTAVTIIRDPRIRRRLGQENQRRATCNFSLDAMVLAYQQQLRQAMDVSQTGQESFF